jgi:citrate lyase subunit beta / citryl-CoA lyase
VTMSNAPLLLRSMLFVPGDSERKLARAQFVHADALIVDLEDSVDAARKDRARELAGEFIGDRSGIRARTVWVRTNPATDPRFADDVAAAVKARADGIVLPKPRSAAEVVRLSKLLDDLEARSGRPLGATKILPIATETPSSALALGGYAECGPRLAALTWGAEDLSEALGAATALDTRGGWLPPYELVRSLCLLAAAAAGVVAIDTVHTDFTDLDGLANVAAAAERDGFAGKLAIHPDQVEILNRTFQPTADAVGAARAVVAAFSAAGGAGVVAHRGRMLDRPHLLRAQRVLALAAALDGPADSDHVH